MTFAFGELVWTSSVENALFRRTLPPEAITASPSVSLGTHGPVGPLRALRLVPAASAGNFSPSSPEWNAPRFRGPLFAPVVLSQKTSPLSPPPGTRRRSHTRQKTRPFLFPPPTL